MPDPIRRLEEQFEKERVQEIRSIQADLDSLDFQNGALKYYLKETINALEAGLLLAALETASASLEIAIRVVLDRRLGTPIGAPRPLEKGKVYPFGGMVSALEEAGILSKANADEIRSFYKSLRIPLHQGLLDTAAHNREEEIGLMLKEALFSEEGGDLTTGSRAVELTLEDRAIPELGHAVQLLTLLELKLV